MKLNEQLRKAAIDSGLSILKISERGKVRYASVHGFIKSGRDIQLSTAEKIAEAIGVSFKPVKQRKAR